MKKLFKKLALAVVALLSFSVGSNYTVKEVRAAEVIESLDFTTKAFKHSAYTDSWEYDGWTVSGGANNNANWAYAKMGGKNTNLSSYNDIYISSPLVSASSSKVEVNIIAGSVSKSGMSATMGLYVYSDSSLSTQIDYVGEKTITSSANLFSFTPTNGDAWPASSYYKVVFTCANTSTTNGIVWLDNVSVYDNTVSQEPQIEVTGEEKVLEVGSYSQLTATVTNSSEEPSWSSSNDDVASVDQNGKVTAKSLGTAVITATISGAEDSFDFQVYPVRNSNISIADALVVCGLTGSSNAPYSYSVTGIVESIDTVYNEEYDNITVTIGDGDNSIQAFRLSGGSDLEKGDKITITGTLTTYNTNCQFAQGATYVEEEITLGEIETMAQLDFGYSYIEGSSNLVEAAYGGTTTTNMTEGNDAATLGLDDTVWSVVGTKGSASNAPGLNKNGTIRLYFHANGSNVITFTNLNEENIGSITINYVSNYANGVVKVGDEVVEATGSDLIKTYAINSSSFSITNGNATNVQVHISSIEITVGQPTTYSNFGNVNLKYSITIPTELFTDVDSFGFNVSVGENNRDISVEKTTIVGDNTTFALVLSNVTDYTSVITVKGYVVIKGQRNEFAEKAYSVATMIQNYLENSSKYELSSEQVAVLTEFQNTIAG